MEFAITFKGDIDPKRTVALARQAEVAGFDYAWFFDSHVLWRDCYTTMALCMENTEHLGQDAIEFFTDRKILIERWL